MAFDYIMDMDCLPFFYLNSKYLPTQVHTLFASFFISQKNHYQNVCIFRIRCHTAISWCIIESYLCYFPVRKINKIGRWRTRQW